MVFLSILFVLLACYSEARTARIQSYEELMCALTEGETVRVTVYYGKCVLYLDGEKQETSPYSIGGLTIEAWDFFYTQIEWQGDKFHNIFT